MTSRIFIDGREGTTGLQIHDRLRAREDLTLLEIDPERRKDREAKRAIMAQADLVVLCLPDAAALEAVAIAPAEARILDASTAHRVDPDWVYGLPELETSQRDRIRNARRVSNPGCWATGFLLATRPLVDAGVLSPDYPVTAHGQSGFSGAGKKLIEAFAIYHDPSPSPAWAVRPYALELSHKHLPEMQRYSGLAHAPLFSPSVGRYYQGMLVEIPLHTRALAKAVSRADVHAIFSERYASERFVRVMPLDAVRSLEGGFLNATALNATNLIELFVFGRAEQLLVIARLDNLGKGAAGAAVQNLNLMLGYPEASGLSIDA